MRLATMLCAVVVFMIAITDLHAQGANDADRIIMRLRSVCNGGQGSTLVLAFDIKARAGSGSKYVGGYSIVLNFDNTKLTLTGLSEMYNGNYWNPLVDEAFGGNRHFDERYAGSALPLNSTYFSPTKNCQGAALNDGFYELLRYQFAISSSANGSVNFSFYGLQPYQGNGPLVPGEKMSATFYSNLQNNSNDSAQTITGLVVPVNLSAFTALGRSDGSADLSWTTESETSNFGFEIERGDGTTFEKIGFVQGHGTASIRNSYMYTDEHAAAAAKDGLVFYRLRQVDNDGTAAYSQIAAVNITPATVGLGQSYPNPLREGASSMLPYDLAVPATVTMGVYNALGQRVAVLAQGEPLQPGHYQASWNGRSESGVIVPAGVYFVRFGADLGGGDVVSQSRQIAIIR